LFYTPFENGSSRNFASPSFVAQNTLNAVFPDRMTASILIHVPINAPFFAGGPDMSMAAVQSQDSSWFFKQLSTAKDRILFVDYDGTVAPFARDRQRALPYAKIPECLHHIMTSCRTRLIMVSGRAANEVPRLLSIYPAPEIWGTDGIERIDSNGRYEEVCVSDDALHALAQAEARLERDGLGKQIEIKLAGVAVHWRGLSPSEILEIRITAARILQPLASTPELVLVEFDEGMELRLASANKGSALRSFLSELDRDIPVAYLGDDISDEEAFRALNGRGLSVLVGSKPRFTAAQMWLRAPDQLIEFFDSWIEACGGTQ
jgi:trehalose 6-phosphate phosphatase